MKSAPTLSEWLKLPRFARLIVLDETEVAVERHNAEIDGLTDDE